MEIGVTLPQESSDGPEPTNLVDATVEQARQAYELGIRTIWLGQRLDYDAIALAALVGREVPGVTVGTSAVPIIGRHPLLVAAQARTTQAATGGRFQLGIALGANTFLGPLFGTTDTRPIAHLREFLTALDPLLRTGEVDFAGELVTARTPWPSDIAGAQPPPPVLVAAMGPQALRVTGELADGTLPFLVGPTTLAGYLVPTVTEAAKSASRPAPRVTTLVTGLVSENPERAREDAYEAMAFYESVPSYRAMLDREGVARAGDLAVIGSAAHLTDGLRRYADAGATELVVNAAAAPTLDEQRRTWELLGKLTDEL